MQQKHLQKKKFEDLDKALDKIRQKYGQDAVVRGGQYVRRRRLSLAGEKLLSSDVKVIDLAVKYGYDSPDSFTKAFTRFHGSTPTDVRRGGAMLKSFAPLHIKLTLDGGSTMEYRIEKKPAIKVMGVSKNFSYENANAEIPQFWNEVFMQASERPRLSTSKT